MTAMEIFSELNNHAIKGLMFHEEMSDYYDFLDLMGFKRLHEYRFIEETAEMRGLHRYFLNHFNMLLPKSNITSEEIIPDSWYRYSRQDVDTNTKKQAVKSAMSKWVEWEKSTKKLAEKSYKDLCDIGEIAAACKVKELISGVDMELKNAERTKLTLDSIDYDLPTIYLMQDDLHEQFDVKTKEIGINIC